MRRSVETPYRTNLEEVDGRISYITVLHYIRFCSYKQTRSGLVRGWKLFVLKEEGHLNSNHYINNPIGYLKIDDDDGD